MIKVINIESEITTSEGRRRNPRLFVGHLPIRDGGGEKEREDDI